MTSGAHFDYTLGDTIVAPATPTGGAGRAIVRISGPHARAIALRRFREFREPRASSSGQEGSSSSRAAAAARGELTIPALASPLPCTAWTWHGPRSYTGEDLVELHLPGSMPLVELVITDCVASGARPAGPGEFTLRAFLAGKLDLTAAEAVLGLTDARNAPQGETALQQLAGGVSRPIQCLRDRLLDLLAELEAELDFVEEDIEFLERGTLQSALSDAAATLGRLDAMMRSRAQSRTQPRVVLAGPPNVGKSSLFNRLLGRAAALVSARPGSTRDYLSGTLPLAPAGSTAAATVELVDTAGAAEPASAVEVQAQLQRSATIRQADLVLWCIDATAADPLAVPAEIQSRPHMTVLTKCDGAAAGHLAVRQPGTARDGLRIAPESPAAACAAPSAPGTGPTEHGHALVHTSAVAPGGIDELRAALRDWLDHSDAMAGEVVLATAVRCRDSIDRALQAVRHALDTSQCDGGDELIAADLHLALDELGKVVGAVYTDDILDRIFSRFCIGK
jgi:tRNA modification GTPase